MKIATLNDIDEVVRMGVAFATALGEDYDEASIRETGMNMINGDDAIILMEGKAMVGGVVVPHFFNYGKLIASELFWWVDEEERGNGSGMGLLAGLEDWARHRGAARISMMTMHVLADIGKIYEKMGYRLFESHWIKEL